MFKIMKYILKNTLLKIRNIKTITFAIIIAVTIWSYNHPLRELTYSIKYPVTWCVFPFMISNLSFLILFWFGIIYINSDIPYMQHSNMYQIIRTGRISWALGQLGGTFFRSFILVVFTAFCSIVSLLPQIEWSLQWGKLIHTIAMTNAAIQYNLKYVFYYQILGKIFTITINDHYNSHMHIYFHVFKFLNVYDKLIFQPHFGSLNYSSINDNAIFCGKYPS